MKNSIKKSLLAIMLLFGAMDMNVQCSEAASGSGAPARQLSAEQEAKAHELYALLFDTLKGVAQNAVAFAQANQPEIKESATFWLGEEQLQKLTQMLLSQIPQETGLTGVSIERLISLSLRLIQRNHDHAFLIFNELAKPASEDIPESPLVYCLKQAACSTDTEIQKLMKERSLYLENIISTQIEDHDFFQLDRPATETNPTQFDNLVTLLGLATSIYFIETIHNTLKRNNKETFSSEHLEKIVKQSGMNTKVKFVDSDHYSCSSENIIAIPVKEYISNPDAGNASILHELGHVENQSNTYFNKVYSMLAIYSYEITKSSLSTEAKLGLLMSAGMIELILGKIDEYRADSFMLKTATKIQLKHYYKKFLEHAKNYSSYFEYCNRLFDSYDIKQADREFLLNLFLDEHITSTSRTIRIKERIQELEAIDERTEAGERSELVQIFSQHRSRL